MRASCPALCMARPTRGFAVERPACSAGAGCSLPPATLRETGGASHTIGGRRIKIPRTKRGGLMSHWFDALLLCTLVLAPAAAVAQEHPTDDPLAYAQARDFTAHRVSSSNPDPGSNDDSKHPIPGEEIVLADLQGPGVVTHI